jgi:cyclic pyranopterin monophosphate synthase
MKDITHKPTTRRTALAAAFLAIDKAILEATDYGRDTDKGNALEASRIAGIMGVKRTWEALPFCHPIPITHCDVEFDLRDDGIYLEVSATTIAPTGVEMEALYAAGVAAMNLYDMLKPHAPKDTGYIAVTDVHLVKKRGGKSDYSKPEGLRAALLVTHDGMAAGEKEDRAGQVVRQILEDKGVEVVSYEIVGNEADVIDEALDGLLEQGLDLIATVGGPGLESKDCTVERVRALIDREAPGVMEAARAYGQARTPVAMLSRGVAGLADETWMVTFPGSTGGAEETANAVITGLLHAMDNEC